MKHRLGIARTILHKRDHLKIEIEISADTYPIPAGGRLIVKGIEIETEIEHG